ncbi:MAG: hypothetical protein M0029_13920, partial [Actinomycetota bacterium]|nr:hypothetical protein [Actinomycetota bacterium]
PALGDAAYQGGVGPGVYDVHSPQVPGEDDIASLLRRAVGAIGSERLWVNPDCGLKTRGYDTVTESLANMVAAARQVRFELAAEARQRGPAEGAAGGALGDAGRP